MSEPHDVLSQLLSPAQADALDRAGAEAWEAAAGVLRTVFGSLPGAEDVEARLVMPEEVAGEYTSPHLVAPLELSTDDDQSATGYLVLDTGLAAIALGSEADEPNDQEQQTIVVASTVVGQVVQALNTQVFAAAANGLVLAMDDMSANAMPVILGNMEDPGMALDFTLSMGKRLPLKLLLPGTFLDIVALAVGGADDRRAVGAASEDDDEPFSLTAEDLDLADLRDEEPEAEPAFAMAGAASHGGTSREPTPIGPAVQRARFAPLAEPEPAARRSDIDLLAGLQMNVTVELGRTALTVADVLGLGPGSVVELDRLAGEPVDILVNDRLIARGEVVVVDENFGVRVVEVVRPGQGEERAS